MTDKNMLSIDLHTHSTASDGTLSPSQLVKAAKQAGLSAIALTDHDTINGLDEFHDECEKLGIEGISGVEISAKYETEMHIVGLYVNKDDKVFSDKLEILKNARAVRNREMLHLLQKNGFDITEDDILSQKEGATLLNTGRSHIAHSMVEKGYVQSKEEAFLRYLKKGNSCYVERVTYSPKESIEIIKNAGGIAILAHPIHITEDYDRLYKLLHELKGYGLDGAECYYNCYTPEFSNMCGEICDKLKLVKSGGSDFHGGNKPDVKLGTVSSGYIPYSVLLKIKEQRGL